jgi:Peptidase A4 family
MRLLRCLVVAGSAGVMAGALTFTASPVVTATAPHRAAHTGSAPSARFLVQARSALVRYLRHDHPGVMFVHPHGAHAGLRGTTNVESFNWSGYADTSTVNGAFTKVSGQWKTPTVSCSKEDRLTSEWVGLDGFSSSTVEQAGTLDWCYRRTATYFTWYEMFPAGTVAVGRSLHPGDQISASVSTDGSGNYTLKVTDSTHPRNSFSKTKTCDTSTCLDTSAEWVAERPAFSIGIAPLANYDTWKLKKGKVTENGKKGTIGTVPNSKMRMIDATEAYTLSSTSALNSSRDAFKTTWHNSY